MNEEQQLDVYVVRSLAESRRGATRGREGCGAVQSHSCAWQREVRKKSFFAYVSPVFLLSSSPSRPSFFSRFSTVVLATRASFPHPLPTAETCRRKTKKKRHDISDRIRDDLSGCELLIDAVTSCIVTVNVILWRIVSTKVINPIRPLGAPFFSSFADASSFLVPFKKAGANSRIFVPIKYSIFGMVDVNTLNSSTIPTSSESSICASFAAPSSSLAIANETAKDRSEPMEDRASDVGVPIDIASIRCHASPQADQHLMFRSEVESASSEGFSLERSGQIGPLRIRRFLFSKSGPYHKPPNQPKCREGVRVRTRPRSQHSNRDSGERQDEDEDERPRRWSEVLPSRHAVCFASTFGATLKTVLDFAGIDVTKSRKVAEALDDIAKFFDPVPDAVASMGGSDREHLLNGLATHALTRRQAKLLDEAAFDRMLRKTWLYKSGNNNVALGATAAILVAHYVLAVTGSEPHEVVTNLSRSVSVTRSLLQEWKSSSFKTSTDMYVDALASEIRALERAHAAAEAAERVAKRHGMDRLTSLHLQLSYMRSAAWPSSAVCDADPSSHAANLRGIAAGESIERLRPDLPLPPLSVQPLRRLRVATRGRDDDCSSEASWSSSGSTVSTASTASTVSSASVRTVSELEVQSLAWSLFQG